MFGRNVCYENRIRRGTDTRVERRSHTRVQYAETHAVRYVIPTTKKFTVFTHILLLLCRFV